MESNEFNKPRKRKAEFIKPPNILKKKVGSGGLPQSRIDEAQRVIDLEGELSFEPMAKEYLHELLGGIKLIKQNKLDLDKETLIAGLIYPTLQLRANGKMFGHSLVTQISNKLIHFLEVIDYPDDEVLNIILVFHSSMTLILKRKMKGMGGKEGQALFLELDNLCQRYFTKYKKR